MRGYTRTLYLTTENRDYLRVDYNLREKKIRLYFEVYSEGGSAYYSIIKDGKVSVERSVLSGRSFGFSEKFRERSAMFSTINNREVLRLIGGNYGIDTYRKSNTERKKRLDETRRKYFKNDANPYGSDNGVNEDHSIKIIDLIDVVIGFALTLGAFFLFQYSYIAMGVVAAFYGISIGMVDMMVRERPPFFIKMFFFLIVGIIFYIYGYFFY